ncbi:MAG: universal stress protein [Bacteroidales bacterium]|nr:universal stress protein [Bacteroidales bacterium]
MKTLAFLIDEIDKSKELIRFAALFAKDINANVHVLHIQFPHVVGTHGYMGRPIVPDPEQLKKIDNEIKDNVNDIITELKAKVSGLPSIEFKSDIGDASEILKAKVENHQYDIVMLQGNNAKGFWLHNSIIMDIVRNVACPVFIIPPDARYQPLKKIIYATDYSEEDITTLKSLIKLAKPFDPEIIALHISNDEEFEKKLKSTGFAGILNEKVDYKNITVRMVADKDGKDAVENLVIEAEKEKVNLIVVLKENRNFFERIFTSSFTEDLIRKVQLPILIYHPK